MANVLGSLSTGLLVQQALDQVFTLRPELRNISISFTNDLGSPVAKFNETVTTRLISIPAVNDFGTGAVDTADTDVPITLNQFKEVQYSFTPQEYSKTDRNLIAERAQPMAIAIADHMVAALAGLWLNANYTNKTTKASAWDYDHLVDMRTALNSRGATPIRRSYVCNPTVYGSLLKDATIIDASKNPSGASSIPTGILNNVAGFEYITEFTNFPGNSENLVAVAMSPDACALAMRVPRDPRELLPGVQFPGRMALVTNPENGMTVMVNEWIDPSTLKANTRLVWMYGVAKAKTANLQRIVTA